MSNFRLGTWFLGSWSTGELANLGSWSTWAAGQLGELANWGAGHEKLDKPLTARSLTAHY